MRPRMPPKTSTIGTCLLLPLAPLLLPREAIDGSADAAVAGVIRASVWPDRIEGGFPKEEGVNQSFSARSNTDRPSDEEPS